MRPVALFRFLSWIAPVVTGIRITNNPAEVVDKSFDYVVVGGGTAGLAVASRLAENSAFSILVIEAGPDAQNQTLVNDPGRLNDLQYTYDWFYNTTRQSVGGSIFTVLQGKLLGGSSSINGMCWTRGTIDQYDSWELLGNPGWNFETMLRYMQKSERYHLPNSEQIQLGAKVDPTVHGFDGYVNAGFPQPYEVASASERYVASIRAAIPGLAENNDVASGTPNGVARFQYSITPGNGTFPALGGNTRSSSANAYIYPSLTTKTNLVILTEHQASSIIWHQRRPVALGSRAAGVNFIATQVKDSGNPGPLSVKVRREVIVSSGAIGSPLFLELSGIGNPRILENVGVPVQVDLPAVGTNLQDQALSYVFYDVPKATPESEYTVINAPTSTTVAFLNISQVLGDNAQAAGNELVASIRSRAKDIVASGAFTSEEGLEKVFAVQARSIIELGAPVIEFSSLASNPSSLPGTSGIVGLMSWNLLPQWRGTVHIQSSNPKTAPELNPQYLTGTLFDLYLKANASRLTRKVFAQSPLKDFVKDELLPGTTVIPETGSDSQWQDFVLDGYSPVLHPVGSVPMLPRKDGGAVGPDLIVYGTANVRVVDASIIPIQLSGHLSATVYGIAEKAADMIKDSSGQQQ